MHRPLFVAQSERLSHTNASWNKPLSAGLSPQQEFVTKADAFHPVPAVPSSALPL